MAIVDRRGVSVSGVDTPIAGNPNPDLAIKAPVKAATTVTRTLSGTQTVDGVALAAGDRVLVKNQTDATTNGLYNVSTGLWTRTIDADNNSQFATGMLVNVTAGTVNAGKWYGLTTADPTVLGTSNITWTAVALSQAQLTSLINVFTPSLSGAVPASGDGTINFLRADGNFAAPSGSLLNAITIVNSDASEQDTTSFTAAYSAYEIVFENVIVDTNAVTLQLQVRVSGTFQTTGYLGNALATSSLGAGPTNTTTSIPLNFIGNLFNGAPGTSGSIRVSDPATNAIHPWWGMTTYPHTAGVADTAMVGGYYNTAGVITGFKVLPSSGLLTSGTIRVYGIK